MTKPDHTHDCQTCDATFGCNGYVEHGRCDDHPEQCPACAAKPEPTPTPKMDRYGIASGTRIHNTMADQALEVELVNTVEAIHAATEFAPTVGYRRIVDREVKESVHRLVRAARDVERQRAYERSIEAFAAMPMFRMSEPEQNAFIEHGRWEGD